MDDTGQRLIPETKPKKSQNCIDEVTAASEGLAVVL
jgi:hypothetical protein